MRKEATKLKKRPHFQLVGVHKCENPDHMNVDSEFPDGPTNPNRVQGGQDILYLTKRERPEGPTTTRTPGTGNVGRRIRTLVGKKNQNQDRDREYETIIRLVSKYEEYCKNGIEHDVIIQLGPGNETTYGELFVNLNDVNPDDLDEGLKIYYGDATVRAYESGLYRINFMDTVYLGGEHRRIGALINEKALLKRKRNMRTFLDDMYKERITSRVYILGEYRINESGNGNEYPVIILNDENMNYCDFR